jgi:hypothetical protein
VIHPMPWGLLYVEEQGDALCDEDDDLMLHGG